MRMSVSLDRASHEKLDISVWLNIALVFVGFFLFLLCWLDNDIFEIILTYYLIEVNIMVAS